MQRRIRAKNVNTPAIDLIEEMSSEDRVKSVRGSSAWMHVHAGGTQAILGNVPGRRRWINEVRNEAEHVGRKKTPPKNFEELELFHKEKNECGTEIFPDENHVGKATSEVQARRNVPVPEFVRCQTTDTEPGFIAVIRLGNVNMTGNALPVKVPHRIEHGAREDERKKVFQKLTGAAVIGIEQKEHPDVNMVGTKASEKSNQRDVAESNQQRPGPASHGFFGKKPISRDLNRLAQKGGFFFCLRHRSRGKRWFMQLQVQLGELAKKVAIIALFAAPMAHAGCFDFSKSISEPLHPEVTKDQSGKLPHGIDWGAVRGVVDQPIQTILFDLHSHGVTKSSRVNKMQIKDIPDPNYLVKQEVQFEVDPFPFVSMKWTEVWAFNVTEGSKAQPTKIVVSYEKVEGTSHIEHLCGNYVLQRVGDNKTDIYIYEEAKADGRGGQDTLNGIKGNLKALGELKAGK